MKIKSLFGFGSVLFFLFLNSCASSSTWFASTWVEKNIKAENLKSITVIGLMYEKSFNLFFEKKFIKKIQDHQTIAFPSPFIITQKEDLTLDKQLIGNIIKKSKGEAVLISQFTAATESDEYVPSFNTGYSHYDSVYTSRSYRPNSMVVSNIYYYYKTSLFDIQSGQLLWSGLTKTWNPESEDQIMDEVIDTVMMELKKLGYISE